MDLSRFDWTGRKKIFTLDMVQKVKFNTENVFLDLAQIENLFWTYSKQLDMVQNCCGLKKTTSSLAFFCLLWSKISRKKFVIFYRLLGSGYVEGFTFNVSETIFVSVPSIYRVILAFLTFTSGLIRWRYGCDAMISKAVFRRVFTKYACTVRS